MKDQITYQIAGLYSLILLIYHAVVAAVPEVLCTVRVATACELLIVGRRSYLCASHVLIVVAAPTRLDRVEILAWGIGASLFFIHNLFLLVTNYFRITTITSSLKRLCRGLHGK